MGREDLLLPSHGLDPDATIEYLIEPSHDQIDAFPLGHHVSWGGHEDTNDPDV
jgi:hypothetical protein